MAHGPRRLGFQFTAAPEGFMAGPLPADEWKRAAAWGIRSQSGSTHGHGNIRRLAALRRPEHRLRPRRENATPAGRRYAAAPGTRSFRRCRIPSFVTKEAGHDVEHVVTAGQVQALDHLGRRRSLRGHRPVPGRDGLIVVGEE
jgi:hypothetical protein